jgi:4-hydroxybenzoate polyprenyltransferase
MLKRKILVIDLDESLLKIDLFKEALSKSLLKQPWLFFKTLAIGNRAKAKTFISKKFEIEWHTLPFDNKVINIIANYRGKGYQIVLVTGAPYSYAESIANYLGLFDKVIATDVDRNNVGGNKLDAIKNEIGDDFIYLGDSVKDLPIWLHCKKAILVGAKNNTIKKLKENNVEIIDIVKKEKSLFRLIIKQLRVHQWSKNILLFVPAAASHQLFAAGVFMNALQGFIAFSLLASSIYILNDIVDIDHDRYHPNKKNRPIASGDLSIFNASGLLLVCFIGWAFLAFDLGQLFLVVSGIYIALNLLYSFSLKRIIILDVILLMFFYTLRLIAGHVLDAIPLSPWLLAFTMFLFFSLGLLKRYVDIIIMRENNALIGGRGYLIDDGNMLMSLGVSSGLISALVLILYTGSDQVREFYSTPLILIALTPVMLYWISRMWLMAERGKIISDPVLFAIKDKHTYIIIFCFLLIILFSKYMVL